MTEAPALDWPIARLRAQLGLRLPGLLAEVVGSTDSTNSRLLQRVRERQGLPCLLVAERQTAGRGRSGSRWQSVPGASLTFSLALQLARPDWSGLSLAVGAALADAIEPPAEGQPPRLQLKWPNDLWLADGAQAWRKLGGILIETAASSGGARVAVIGVGINVLPVTGLPDLASGYACVQELHAAVDAPCTLERLADPLLAAVLDFDRGGLTPFAARYARRDLLCGRAVRCMQAAVGDGSAEGIAADGALLVRSAGVLHRVSAGEVSVRPLPLALEVG